MTTQDTAAPQDQPEAAPAAPTAPPDDDKLQDDLYEVTADQWGWRGEYTKGMVIHRADPEAGHYDVEHAIRVGTLRPLSVAQARAWTPPAKANAASQPSPRRTTVPASNEPG